MNLFVYLFIYFTLQYGWYPINFLRNVAVQYSRTENVIHLDVDFVTSPNLLNTLKYQPIMNHFFFFGVISNVC